MSFRSNDEAWADESNSNPGDSLRQALMRLTSPQVEDLQSELSRLKEQVDLLKKLEGATNELQKKISDISSILDDAEKRFLQLGNELRDPAMIEQRLETTVIPAIHKQVNNQGDDVAEALAPAIGPAIRRQIRDSRDDIIDALYPLIGQIISKAISEALRELTRNIDARLRQQLNFRDRLNQTFARLRGVSEAELLIRGSLPYSVERVFLIHRETGILLCHLSNEGEYRGQMDTISGMLTAIQDFVRDSFSAGEGELEEITHGGRRILLESGQRAYIAVVLIGVEPEGYSHLIRDVINTINVQHENELKKFDGNMERLPDFQPTLNPLLVPRSTSSTEPEISKPLSSPQKRLVGFTLISILLLVATLIFACVFMVRLWPVAFHGSLSNPTSYSSLTPALLPTFTPISITLTHTSTVFPTLTSTTQPHSPAPLPVGVLTGNLSVRTEPSTGFPSQGVILAGEKVIIKEQQGIWYFVSWPPDGEPKLEGWINGEAFLELPKDYLP